MPVVHRWKINRDIKIAIRIKAFKRKIKEKIGHREKRLFVGKKNMHIIEKILKMYEPLVKKLHKVHNKNKMIWLKSRF